MKHFSCRKRDSNIIKQNETSAFYCKCIGIRRKIKSRLKLSFIRIKQRLLSKNENYKSKERKKRKFKLNKKIYLKCQDSLKTYQQLRTASD